MRLLSINHYWRIFAAGFSYVVFGLGALLPGLYMICLSIVPLSAQSKQSQVRRLIQKLCRFYVWLMASLGIYDFHSNGLDRRFVRGHLVICNHSSLIDALFVLAYVDNLCCIVKYQLLLNPFTRIPVKLAGYIANDDSDFVARACEKIDNNENVLIFPEGTRNQHHTQLQFKRGAANIAVKSKCPILPLVIVPNPRVVQKGEPWYQLPKVKSIITMSINEPLELADCIDTDQPRTIQYRRLNQFWRNYYLEKINAIIDPQQS